MSLLDQAYEDAPITGTRRGSGDGESEFSKGLRGATAGMGAQLGALGQSGLRAFGGSVSPESTQALQQNLMEAQQAEAAAANPTWDSVHGLRDFGNWSAYKAGQLLPALAGGMGAGLVGGLTHGKAGAIVAPTAAFTPFEAGDISLRQMQDPEAQGRSDQENLGRAALGGLASSAVQNVIPGVMANRLLGGGAAEAAKRTFGQSVARNMGEGILGQGAAGAAGEGIRQVSTSDRITDMGAVGEMGAENALLGGAFGTVGVAGDMIHGMPRKALNGVGETLSGAGDTLVASKAGKAATGAWDQISEVAQGLYEGATESKLGKGLADGYKTTKQDITDLLNDVEVPDNVKATLKQGAKDMGDAAYDAYVAAAKTIRETVGPVAGKVQEKGAAQTALDYLNEAKQWGNRKLGDLQKSGFFGDPEAMRRAGPEEAKRMADASDAEAERRAQAEFEELMKGGTANDEVKAAGQNLKDPNNRATVAKAADDQGFTASLSKKISAFAKGLGDAVSGDKGTAKKSEDFSAAHDIIAKELLPAISDDRIKQALASNKPMQTELVSGIRQWMALAGKEANIPKGKDGRYENLGKFRFDNKKAVMFDNLVSILGPDTGPVLHKVYDAIRGKDPEEVNNVFGHINGAVDTHDTYFTVQQGLVSMLPRGSEHYGLMNSPETAKHLMNWVRARDNKPTEESVFLDKEMHRQLQAIYGKKADKAYALLENAAKVERGRPSNITGADQKVGKSVGETDEARAAEQAAREGEQRANSEAFDAMEERYRKDEDGNYRDLFVGKNDKEGRLGVAGTDGVLGINGLLEHPDVQKGKFSSSPSYTQHVMDRMAAERPNHKWEFVSMRDHADRLEQGGMKSRDVIADIDKNFPDLAEVPEHEWHTHGYLRGVNKETGQGELYIGKGDKIGTVKRSTSKLNGLFRSPEHEIASGKADAQSSTEARIRELRNQYPGYNVSFVSLKDYAKSVGKSHRDIMETFPDAGEEESAGNLGYIKLQGKDRDVDGLAPYELRRVQLDAKNHGRSPARFNVGDTAWDAVKLTSEFMKKMGHDRTSGGEANDMTRIKEAFTNGYAAVMDHTNTKMEGAGKDRLLGDIDPNVVVAYRKGRKITVGDLTGDLGTRFPEPKNLSEEMQKQLAYVDEMSRGELMSAHMKAWQGEDRAREKLHAAAVAALEGSGLEGADHKKALGEWKKAHLADPDFRIPEREAWTNALQRALDKDHGRQEEILGSEYGSPQRTGKVGDRDALAGEARAELATAKHELTDREQRIAVLERRLEGITNKAMVKYLREEIDQLTNGVRMFPDKKGQLPLGGDGKPMDSLADLRARVQYIEKSMRDAPKAAELNAAVAKQRMHIEALERKMFDTERGPDQDAVIRQLEQAHEQLTKLTQERLYRSGDPYGGLGSGKREADPFGDIGTTSSLFSDDDLRIRTNHGDGSFRDDYSKGRTPNPNVYEHNKAIDELKGQITTANARIRALGKEGSPSEINALRKQIETYRKEKDRLTAQNGMLTDKGHAAFQETFAKRLDSFMTEWRSSTMTATKKAVMDSLQERATKLATYADVLAPAMRDKLLDFAVGGNRKVASPVEAKAALDALITAAKEEIRKKDFREAHPPTNKAAKVEGTPDPKAVAAKKAAFLEKAASGDKGLIKELSESTDAKGLQRAVEALNAHEFEGMSEGDPRADNVLRAIDAANARIAELIKADPTVAYGMLTKKYSMDAQRVAPGAAGPKQSSHKDILDYLHKVLGNTVSLEMANILHAGEFSREQVGDVIRVSVHSLNPMSVAHHEALHAFFQQLRDRGHPEISNVVERMAMSPHIQSQLRERLAHSPEALRQLKDPEEAAAYAYQFWATDKSFKLQAEQVGVFNRIKQFFRNILGIWSNDQRAEHILNYFNDGDYAKTKSDHALVANLMESGKNETWEAVKGMTKPLANLRDALVTTGSERLHDTGIPALKEMAKLIKASGIEESSDAGYIPAARVQAATHMDKLAKYLGNATEAQIQEGFKALQEGGRAGSTQGRIVQTVVKKFLREMRDDYLLKAGVDLGDLGPDYFPRVYDPYYISQHQDEFKAVLSKYGVSEDTMHRIIAGDGVPDGVVIDKPGMQARKERKLAFIPDAELAPFMKKDFYGVMGNYVAQATKRAEWARRFNDDSSGYHDLLAKAAGQGATKEHLATAEDYVKGVNGTLGDDISPDARRLMGNMMVYQNVRLLPMMVFSSMVDPMGIVVRGGKLGDAWNAYKRGARELFKAWQSDPKFDGATEMAATMGIIDNAALSHTMSQTFGGMTGGVGEKINNAFFKLNFAEQVNQSMRVSAMEAAKRFIVRHVDHPTAHSERYLRELGLTAKDVVKDAEGELLMDPSNTKIKMALNRWVDGAVLRPDAADKPIWMNDPHYALIGHLKQFAFAFQSTILGRIMHEAEHGNYTPMLAAASYVPIMFAADAAKSVVTSGSLEPDWKAGWSLADHVGYEVQRAGLLGVSQFTVDAMNDVRQGGTGIGRLLGPTIEQLAEVAQLAGGRKEFAPVALHAMPANALYANWVNSNDRVREAAAD